MLVAPLLALFSENHGITGAASTIHDQWVDGRRRSDADVAAHEGRGVGVIGAAAVGDGQRHRIRVGGRRDVDEFCGDGRGRALADAEGRIPRRTQRPVPQLRVAAVGQGVGADRFGEAAERGRAATAAAAAGSQDDPAGAVALAAWPMRRRWRAGSTLRPRRRPAA